MRILQIHNRYRPGWGGEETVVGLEADLLHQNGHQVELLSLWTKELEGAGPLRLLSAGLGTVWSLRGYRLAEQAIARFSPQVIHVHNTFPLFSPSIFWAADRAGVPVVVTLHNYRFICASALLLRADKPCEKCVGHFPWPALRYRCLGDSFLRTAAVSSNNVVHRWVGTFQTKIHAYIALTEFSKEIFVRAGLPRERIFVKPNFQADSGKLCTQRHHQVVFVGEISRAKGSHLLLEAWTRLPVTGARLMMAGHGPCRSELEQRYAGVPGVVWCGALAQEKVIELVAASQWLVLPSLAYENFPLSLLEAFSVGTPVIVPNHGVFAVIVTNNHEGLQFSAGDAGSLAANLRAALVASDGDWARWSANARKKFLREYSCQANYNQLMSIYAKAMDCFHASRSGNPKFRRLESVALTERDKDLGASSAAD